MEETKVIENTETIPAVIDMPNPPKDPRFIKIPKGSVLQVNKTETGSWVQNPLTGKSIKVQGPMYLKLVKAKILGIDPNDCGRILYVGEDNADALQAVEKIPVPKQLVKRVRNNRVYSQPRGIRVKELNQRIQELTLKIYQENKEHFNNNMTPDQIRDTIKQLVNQKLISEDNKDISIRREIEYVIEKAEDDKELEEECSDSEDEDDDEEGSGSEEELEEDE
jgi:hypothetical protein